VEPAVWVHRLGRCLKLVPIPDEVKVGPHKQLTVIGEPDVDAR